MTSTSLRHFHFLNFDPFWAPCQPLPQSGGIPCVLMCEWTIAVRYLSSSAWCTLVFCGAGGILFGWGWAWSLQIAAIYGTFESPSCLRLPPTSTHFLSRFTATFIKFDSLLIFFGLARNVGCLRGESFPHSLRRGFADCWKACQILRGENAFNKKNAAQLSFAELCNFPSLSLAALAQVKSQQCNFSFCDGTRGDRRKCPRQGAFFLRLDTVASGKSTAFASSHKKLLYSVDQKLLSANG